MSGCCNVGSEDSLTVEDDITMTVLVDRSGSVETACANELFEGAESAEDDGSVLDVVKFVMFEERLDVTFPPADSDEEVLRLGLKHC